MLNLLGGKAMEKTTELLLIRTSKDNICSIGELSIDGEFECFTLEDVERAPGLKVYGQTAIPHGRYEIKITYSPRFKRQLPLLLDVPGFEGIRIHPGNTAKDTEVCILPGTEISGRSVINSRVAFNALFGKLVEALKVGKVFITIK